MSPKYTQDLITNTQAKHFNFPYTNFIDYWLNKGALILCSIRSIKIDYQNNYPTLHLKITVIQIKKTINRRKYSLVLNNIGHCAFKNILNPRKLLSRIPNLLWIARRL